MTLLAVLAGLAVPITLSATSGPARNAAVAKAAVPAPAPPAAVEAGLLPWRLTAPLSREVVLPQPRSQNLLVVGGLDSAGSSAAGVYSLDTRSGRLSLAGGLARPTHDAAGAIVGGRALVIGGGSAVPAAMTQRLELGANVWTASSLAKPRADAAAAVIGKTVYVVGGYDGRSMYREVTAIGEGESNRPVAALPVPVRYPAVATLAGRIYVFGGTTRDGRPTNVVQAVDPRSRTAKVVGRLPFPLSGAVAALLGTSVYIAGGSTGTSAPPSTAVLAFDVVRMHFLRAGSLQVGVANAGATVSGGRLWIVGGDTAGGRPSDAVQVLAANRSFGVAGRPGAGSPFYGSRLLIADRGNNRLLLLNDTNKVVWSYPSETGSPPPGGFYFPDDAFFIHHGHAIISNQEDNNTIVEIDYPSGHILFRYGHPRQAGSAAGYLDSPDDAYLLRNGEISVADAKNCRVLLIDAKTKRVVRQIGTPGHCLHQPPTDLGSPNGTTPLANGNLLISEINGSWVDEYTRTGRLVWDVKLPIGYPSDPQQLGPDRYLIADYENPGAIVEFDRHGRILYRYQPRSGPGMLNRPSLVERLPSGAFMVNDDYNDRMVAIDPSTGALVWQYGQTGQAGSSPGMLNTPDGFDLLQPGGATPTHSATG